MLSAIEDISGQSSWTIVAGIAAIVRNSRYKATVGLILTHPVLVIQSYTSNLRHLLWPSSQPSRSQMARLKQIPMVNHHLERCNRHRCQGNARQVRSHRPSRHQPSQFQHGPSMARHQWPQDRRQEELSQRPQVLHTLNQWSGWHRVCRRG